MFTVPVYHGLIVINDNRISSKRNGSQKTLYTRCFIQWHQRQYHMVLPGRILANSSSLNPSLYSIIVFSLWAKGSTSFYQQHGNFITIHANAVVVNKFLLISFFRYVLGEILSSRHRDVIVENIQDYLRSGKLLAILLQYFVSCLTFCRIFRSGSLLPQIHVTC